MSLSSRTRNAPDSSMLPRNTTNDHRKDPQQARTGDRHTVALQHKTKTRFLFLVVKTNRRTETSQTRYPKTNRVPYLSLSLSLVMVPTLSVKRVILHTYQPC